VTGRAIRRASLRSDTPTRWRTGATGLSPVWLSRSSSDCYRPPHSDGPMMTFHGGQCAGRGGSGGGGPSGGGGESIQR
jgi:hypothetical protein